MGNQKREQLPPEIESGMPEKIVVYRVDLKPGQAREGTWQACTREIPRLPRAQRLPRQGICMEVRDRCCTPAVRIDASEPPR